MDQIQNQIRMLLEHGWKSWRINAADAAKAWLGQLSCNSEKIHYIHGLAKLRSKAEKAFGPGLAKTLFDLERAHLATIIKEQLHQEEIAKEETAWHHWFQSGPLPSDDPYLALLRRKADQIRSRGSPGMDSIAVLNDRWHLEEIQKRKSGKGGKEEDEEKRKISAIIRWFRPVLTIAADRIESLESPPEFQCSIHDLANAASTSLLEMIAERQGVLEQAIRAVGRIELANNSRFQWIGTGWIIATELGDDIIVTNEHIAKEFGMRSGVGFQFRPSGYEASLQQSGLIDFREEIGSTPARKFPITEIVWLSEDPAFDVAFLRVARGAEGDRIDPPIKLLTNEVSDDRMLAVIGFPGPNHGYDPEPFKQLFGSIFGKKRFSPGFFTGRRGVSITHDCSTLPGSSGSVLLDVKTGYAVGLHFRGTAFDANYAVPAADLARIAKARPWQH